jgi:hypothetical protein
MLHRRDAMIRLGQLGLGTLGLPGLLGATATPVRRGPAKSCIYLFLWGGPPQIDLWDPKPDAPQGIRSLFGPARTNVPGIDFCDQMPLLARHADKLAVVRSLSHASDNHEPSVYHMLTGRTNPTLVVPRNSRRRSDFPSVGSVVSALSPAGNLPTTVTIPRPIGHDGVTYAGTYGGFLGPRHDPMELKEAPNSGEQATHPLAPSPGLTPSRMAARRGLLHALEQRERGLQRAGAADGLGGFYEQAFRMLTSSAARRAFALDLEPPAVREHYGRNEYGESLLLARRLVEAGVRLVTVTWMYIGPTRRVFNVWDNHSGLGIHGAKTGYDLLKSPVCIPPLDRGLSALLGDLKDRGLLDETLVSVAGEFGRTPKLNKDAGRDHWGKCQTALLAGGGVRGGQLHGATDSHAAFVKDRPVSPEDFLATIHLALGISPESEVRDRTGRPYRVVEGAPVESLF